MVERQRATGESMPKPDRETDDELRDPSTDKPVGDRQFSQDRDDKAGRSWSGLNSEPDLDEVGRFEEDADDEEARPGRTDRV
jgi:hypothetical protein